VSPICNKSFVGWDFAPDPTGGAYSAPPDPIAVFRGLASKGRGGDRRGGEEKSLFCDLGSKKKSRCL